MPRYAILCASCLASMFVAIVGAVEPVPLPTSWPSHPRLIASEAAWLALPGRRAADPGLDSLCNRIVVEATALVGQAPLVRPANGSILEVCSRPLIHRVTTLAFAYRTTGERRYLDQAKTDLLAVCAYSDWYPSHFLDVAEMAAGVALGYDWLYDALTAGERSTIRTALKSKALNLASSGREELTRTNNWGQVCGGGLGLACLAIGDEDPSLASTVLGYIRAGIPNSQGAYAPDGIFPEGPIYWGYASVYQVLLISGLRTNLNDDWGLDAYPGFRASARFYAHATGPDEDYFNYADCWPEQTVESAQLFMAKELGAPELAQASLRLMADASWKPVPVFNKGGAYPVMCAFWWPDVASGGEPLYFSGQGTTPMAAWRSSWGANAFYVATKAGKANSSHGHMDAGSFVLSSDGVRWGADLGTQDYTALQNAGINLWNYSQSSSRWNVFRFSSESHNTLTINGQKHLVDGMSQLVSPTSSGAVIEMGPVLGVTSARRTFAVNAAGGTCAIADSIIGAPGGATIRWAMATYADVQITGTTALLEQDGRRMAISFQSAGATIASVDASQPSPSYNAANPGLRMLTATIGVPASGTCSLNVVCAAAPVAPGTLDATTRSSTQIDVRWTPVAERATGYELERSTTSGGWARVAVLTASEVVYIDTGLQPATTYQYRVRAVNGAAPSDYSATVSATTAISPVQTVPAFSVQPQSVSVVVGQTATFSVAVSGSPAPTCKWQRNGVDIAGATSVMYTTPVTVVGDHGAVFRCVATNSAGSAVSNAAILSVTAAPTIVTQPTEQTVVVGQTATFAVTATGNPSPTYRWQRDGADIAGATSASYTTPSTVHTDSGKWFRCVVTNSVGSTLSNAAELIVTNAPMSPVISIHPENLAVVAGRTATFCVVASGYPSPTFQWQRDGVDIAGATDATYTTPLTVANDNGAEFRCMVTNVAGTVVSHPAILTVSPGQVAIAAADSSGCGLGGLGVLCCCAVLLLSVAGRRTEALA